MVETIRKPNGPAVAALLSAMIGILILGAINVGTEASSSFSTSMLEVGKVWIPNAQGIGPYSGKETIMVVGWLLSWVALHLALRRKDVNLKTPTAMFVIGLVLATLFVYTPFIDLLLGK
ncbi:MAG: hypothetical protein HYU39_04085 [Thaumarchaeota archaeon]|nr:hypothetical protein [Nitrososphaerota archaeon]